jgi:hypothetical protein
MVNVTRGINQRCKELQKEMCVNVFVSILLAKSQKRYMIFFNKIPFNDPDCNALTKAKERLSEQDKQG